MGMIDRVEVTRKVCPVIILADKSISMDGLPIGSENAAIEGILPELASMNKENPDAFIKFALMEFSTGVNWKTGIDGLVDPAEYKWVDLVADGATSFGLACKELNNKLSVSHGFMKQASGSMSPVIILISDGEPTDSYSVALAELKKNNWFKVAAKIAIGYGKANDKVLEEFTGNPETVIHTNDVQELKNLIKFVAITSSMVVSIGQATKSNTDTNADPDDTTSVVADALKQAQAALSDATDPGEEW